MNHRFTIPPPFQVPDGTWVSPFLNAKDSQSELPFDLFDGFSIAAGRIDPGTRSQIHIMPLVSQVTFVLRGNLKVKMQSHVDAAAYELEIDAGEGALTEPGVAFQLVNNGPDPCEVLYIVSPAYVFDMSSEGEIRYDDAVIVGRDWGDVETATASKATFEVIKQLATDRQEALNRIKQRKSL